MHSIILASTGVLLVLITVILVRRGHLAMRYGLGWLAIGSIAIIMSPILRWLDPIANWLGLSVPGLVVAAATIFLTIVTLQLSLALSGMRDQVRCLAERDALLKAEILGGEAGQTGEDDRGTPRA